MSHLIEPVVTDDQVLADLEQLGHSVAISTELAKNGMSDALISFIKSSRENPLAGMLTILDTAEESVRNHIESLLLVYLRAFGEGIEAVYRTQRKGRVMEYVVALRTNDLDIKFNINEFALVYMQTSFQGRWPLVIHYITPDKATALVGVDKLELSAR